MRVVNRTIATNVPLNANYNSTYVPLKSIFMYSVVAVVTGTPAGTISLQASNDPETNDTQYNVTANRPPAVGPVNWTTITGTPTVISTSGNIMWNIEYCAYNYVRVVYTDSSGGTSTATATLIFNGKGS